MNRLKQVPKLQRMKELILRICRLSETDESFGSVKLNKLLFYADFQSYVRLGKSITGYSYQKEPLGPAPRMIKPTLKKMRKRGELAIREREVEGGFVQRRCFALRDARVHDFTKEEIALVDEIVAKYRDCRALEISKISHDFIGWDAANMYEEIPYGTALWMKPVLSEKEIKHGLKLKDKFEALQKVA